MQTRTLLLIAITAGLLSGASLFFFCHYSKEKEQEKTLDAHKVPIQWHHICSCAEERKTQEILAYLKKSCNHVVK